MTAFIIPGTGKVAGQAGFVTDINNLYAAVTQIAALNVQSAAFGAAGDGVTDDTAAIQLALNSVPTNGQVVYLPPGQYKITSPLVVQTTGTILAGSGWGSNIRYDGTVVTGGAIQAASSITWFVRDLRITQTAASSAGTAVNASNMNAGALDRVLIDGATNAPNIGIDFNSSTAFYNSVNHCFVHVDGANAAGVRFTGGANNNHTRGGRVFISGSDATQTGYVVNAKSCSLYSPNCQGGAGIGLDIQSTGIACSVYDPYFENNAVANVRFASGVLSPTILGGTVENDTAYTPNITDNGAITPIILNARTSHGGDIYAHTKAVLANAPGPEDHGFISWAFDPAVITNSSAITAGVAYFVKLPVRYVATISKVFFGFNAAASGVTAGQNFFGLYQAASPSATTLTLLASGSADSVITSTGFQSVSITPQAVTPGYVYACIMCNATGMPTLYRNTSGPALGNANLTTSNFRFFSNTTGNTTALPASVTLASNSSGSGIQDFWGAVA